MFKFVESLLIYWNNYIANGCFSDASGEGDKVIIIQTSVVL